MTTVPRGMDRKVLLALERCFQLGIDRFDSGAMLVCIEYGLDWSGAVDLERKLDLNRGVVPFSTRLPPEPLPKRQGGRARRPGR